MPVSDTDCFTRPVKVERFQCEHCGWWADIPDGKTIAFFSREYCPTCRRKLNKVMEIGPIIPDIFLMPDDNFGIEE